MYSVKGLIVVYKKGHGELIHQSPVLENVSNVGNNCTGPSIKLTHYGLDEVLESKAIAPTMSK